MKSDHVEYIDYNPIPYGLRLAPIPYGGGAENGRLGLNLWIYNFIQFYTILYKIKLDTRGRGVWK